ncbi:MAG TPA: hypothetical protein VHR86_07995 [Armatimonadota bacterium]|nr:hypothetical protein [Armatimonadota bacterium]
MSPNINPDYVITLQGQEYCTYRGVLDRAHALGLEGIRTRILQIPQADNEYVAIVEAEVHLKDGRVFVDVADASPKNVPQRLVSALIRMASTRAKGRALRDAVNIGEALAEELSDMMEVDHTLPRPAHAVHQHQRPQPVQPAQKATPAAGDGEVHEQPAVPLAKPEQPAASPAHPARQSVIPEAETETIPAADPEPSPAPQAEPDPQAAPAESAEVHPEDLVCSNPECNRVLTQGQYDFSVRAYGVALCPRCQRKQGVKEKVV